MTLVLLFSLLACGPSPAAPAALEVCNGLDDDGDGAVDEALRAAWYADADGDGFGAGYAVERCTRTAAWVAVDGDCDDADPSRAPGRPETCNGHDDDCDGEVDEEVTGAWFSDDDGDGWGDESSPIEACAQPEGTSRRAGDCDDAQALVNPGADETCDGVDQDCDDVVDDGVLATWHPDDDGDGFGDADRAEEACDAPEGWTTDATDCDDAEGAAHPDGVEACNTWVDEDCDGTANDCALAGDMGLAEADLVFQIEGSSRWGLDGGDLDGDGLADLVVGRPDRYEQTIVGDAFVGELGAVSVLLGVTASARHPYGREPLVVTSPLDISSGETDVDTELGETVLVADVDGDGAEDLLAGAPGWDPAGRVLVARGPVAAWDWAIRGEDTARGLGSQLAVAEDADGDGALDLLVGETGTQADVFLVLGPLVGSVTAEDAQASQWRGSSPLVDACDADGDGLSDVLLREESLYVSLAPHAGLVEVDDVPIALGGAGTRGAVACGELDGDGYPDLLVGVPNDATSGASTGAVYLVYGPVTASADLTTWDAVYGLEEGDQLGASVTYVGDTDGDGVDDVAVGAPGEDTAGEGSSGAAGAVYLLQGPIDPALDLADAPTFYGDDPEGGAGAEIAGPGDLDGDGYADLAIGGSTWGTQTFTVFGRGL